jgi:hypothetical protein
MVDEYGALGGMQIVREDRRIWIKSAPLPIRPRTQATALVNRRQTTNSVVWLIIVDSIMTRPGPVKRDIVLD